MSFKEFLFEKFLDWQREVGRKSQKDFAEYLGVPPTSYSTWINTNSKPGDEYIPILAKKLGDEVYDILGRARPLSPVKQKLFNWINNLSETEAEKRIKEIESAQQTNPVLSGKPKKAK